MTKNDAIKLFHEIQAGAGLDRLDFPEQFKADLAQLYWEDPVFMLGMEYGVLWALTIIFSISIEDLKEK